MKLFNKLIIMGVFSLLAPLVLSQAAELIAPAYNTMNRHDVNMSTGSVQITKADVSIGGEMGLSHSISMHSNEWVGYDNIYRLGPVDRFEGRAVSVLAPGNVTSHILISDGSATYRFSKGDTGTTPASDRGYYSPLSHPASSLVYEAGVGFVLTTADGTRVTYPDDGSSYVAGRGMSKIEKPNGLIIDIVEYDNGRKVYSVKTNTGWQLKYYYVNDDRPLSSALAAKPNDKAVPASSFMWAENNPRYIKAINNTVEYCSHTYGVQINAGECSANAWPTAEHIWPAGMPRRMYVADGTFSVIDAGGIQTDYLHRPYDKAYQNPSGTWTPASGPNVYMQPRLVEVTDSVTNTALMRYEYEHQGKRVGNNSSGHGIDFPYWVTTAHSVLKRSW